LPLTLAPLFVMTAALGASVHRDYAEPMEVARMEGAASVVEFTACADALPDSLPSRIDGRAALTPARDAHGRAAFFGWGDGRWNRLAHLSVAPTAGVSFTGRIETRQVGETEVVSYLVKTNAAASFVRLHDANGREWFSGGTTDSTSSSIAAVIPSVLAAGDGEVAVMGWDSATSAASTVLHWIGAEGADWNDGANWSLGAGGESAGRVPSQAGEIAQVDGKAEILYDGELVTVRNLLVEFGEGYTNVIGGEVVADEVKLKTNRLMVGKTLRPELGTMFGTGPWLDCAWYRADWMGNYESTPVTVGSEYILSRDDREHWLLFVAHDERGVKCRQEFYFSELPVLYLATKDGVEPTAAKEEHDASVFIQGNAEWKHQYDGDAVVKVRGNTTANYAKKPYKLKLDKKTNLFDMGKNKHWVLLANWQDQSLMRNKLAGDFANAIGFLGMDSTWVQCVLNGRFVGTYQLSEHVRPDANRVPVFDWEGEVADETDLSGIDPATTDITGGYLFEFTEEYDELTKFTTNAGKLQMRTVVSKPEYLYTNPAMLQFCQNFLGQYWQACTAWNGCSSAGRHWSDYCDVGSMVDFFLVNELFSNTDSCKHSRFAYLNRGGKLMWGPVWDFDCSSGYYNAGTTTPTVWATAGNLRGELSVKYAMQKEWATDPWFCHRLRARYWEVRREWMDIFREGGLIDQNVAKLALPAAVNDVRWSRPRTFTEDAAILKSFLAARLEWLDAQFADTDTLVASLRTDIATHPYTKNISKLPLAFDSGLRGDGALAVASNGAVHIGQSPLRLAFIVGDTNIKSVEVFVNGRQVGTRTPVVGGRVEQSIPASLLNAGAELRDLVAVVAYDSSGTVLARSYALVCHDHNGTRLYFR